MKNISAIVLTVVLLTSWECSRVCGDLTDEQCKFIHSVEVHFHDQIKLKPIPCEYRFISVYLKEGANDSLLYELHDSIRNSKHSPWNTLDVYDWNHEHLFQQYYIERKNSYQRRYFN